MARGRKRVSLLTPASASFTTTVRRSRPTVGRSGSPFPSRDFKQTTQNRTHDIHTQNESLYDDNGATKYPTDGTASHFGRLIEALEIQAHPRRSHTRRDVIVDRISIDIYKQPVYNGRRPSCPSSSPRFVTLVVLEESLVRHPTGKKKKPREGEREPTRFPSLVLSLVLSLSLSRSLSLSLSFSRTHAASVPSFWTESPSIPAAPARRTLPTMTSWCQRRSRVGTAVRTCSRTW